MVRILVAATLLSLAQLSLGCGASDRPPAFAVPRSDPGERILQIRASARAIFGDPRTARTATIEYARVESYIAKAEFLFRSNSEPALRDLLLDTAEGELSSVKARAALARAKSNPALHPAHDPTPPEATP